MNVWYFPSMHGDFRLLKREPTKKGSERSVLEIVEPTLAEIELLDSFLAEARDKGWTRAKGVKLTENSDGIESQTVKLTVGVAYAGQRLIEMLKPGEQTLTAIKSRDGQVHVTTSSDSAELAALAEKERQSEATNYREPPEHTKATEPPPKKKPPPVAAASVKRPTPCCPNCQPGSVARASEVLLSFLTPAQHAQWAQSRTIDVVGHLSGHTYRIAHRHSAQAHAWTKICADLTDGGILHFHDWSVPPEEEVLAAKLCLEHCEPWLRNEATCIGFIETPSALPFANSHVRAYNDEGQLIDTTPGLGQMAYWTDIFKNPFGGGGDGLADAAFAREIGGFFLGLTGRQAW